MKIGIVLANPPQNSETFLNSFINIVHEQHSIVLFVSKKSKKISPEIVQKCYLNNDLISILKAPWIFMLLICNIKRYRTLRDFQISRKQLIADIYIWTFKNLDYLHFGFGNLVFGREYYGKAMGCKMSLSFRGSDINVFPIWHDKSYNLALHLATKVHANSKELLDKLKLHNKFVQDKAVIIKSGLQYEFVASRKQIESYLGLRKRNDKIEIVSVGRLHWVKGYEIALASLHLFKKKGHNFKYTIIGGGVEIEKITYLINHYDLVGYVDVASFKKPNEIRKILEHSNLFIQTSWAEGFSNSTLEAQALGIPVVVTPVSGMDSIVEHLKTGFISNDFTPENVVKGLEWYISLASNDLRSLAYESSTQVQERFSYDNLKQNWLHFFN